MRASELIGLPVVSASGSDLGVVRDLRVRRDQPDNQASDFRIAGIVIGRKGMRDLARHSWGYAEGRADGPALFAALLGSSQDARFARSDSVERWGPDRVVLSVRSREHLPRLAEIR